MLSFNFINRNNLKGVAKLCVSFVVYLPFFLFFTFFLSCQQKQNQASPNNENVVYASEFSIDKQEAYTLLSVHNPWKKGEILQKYVLVPKSRDLAENLPSGTLIRTPLENVVCFSSVICGFLEELEVIQCVTGVAESEYIKIPSVQKGIRAGKIIDVGQASNPDVEKLFMLNPEVIFVNTLQDVGVGQVGKTGIPLIECMEYTETLPLGQTEWIRFLSFFFEKEDKANEVFGKKEEKYLTLKKQIENPEYRPTVFTETMYSGVWYIPGGKSYMSHLLADAGADYLWKDDSHSGSISCSFEQVLDKAGKADFWLMKHYDPQAMTYKDLVSKNANYALFEAYKNRHIFTCNTFEEMYYEDLPIHPDRILANLIRIFHPEAGVIPEVSYYAPMSQ